MLRLPNKQELETVRYRLVSDDGQPIRWTLRLEGEVLVTDQLTRAIRKVDSQVALALAEALFRQEIRPHASIQPRDLLRAVRNEFELIILDVRPGSLEVDIVVALGEKVAAAEWDVIKALGMETIHVAKDAMILGGLQRAWRFFRAKAGKGPSI